MPSGFALVGEDITDQEWEGITKVPRHADWTKNTRAVANGTCIIVHHHPVFLEVLHVTGWLNTAVLTEPNLNGDPMDHRSIRTLLFFLDWSGLAAVAMTCTDQGLVDTRAVVRRRSQEKEDDADACTVCCADLHGHESGSCVMCGNVAICPDCEYIYPERLPSQVSVPPKRFRYDASLQDFDTSEVQAEDTLCLMCCQEGASPEQVQKYIIFAAFADIEDCVRGHGAFYAPPSDKVCKYEFPRI